MMDNRVIGAGSTIKKPEIVMLIDDLGNTIDTFSVAISNLEDRLAPIMSPSNPPEKELRTEVGAMTEIGSKMANLCGSIRHQERRVRDLISRLEI